MSAKKIFFSNDSFVRGAEKVTLVDDIKKADIVIDEKDIVDKSFKSDKKYKVVSNSRLADKKVYIKKSKNTSSKNDSSGGGALLFSIVFLISPFLVFKAMPIFGMLLTATYILSALYFILEPIIIKRKYDIPLEYKRGLRIYQKASYFFIGATYLFFCLNCFSIFLRHRESNYKNASFLFVFKWLTIAFAASIVILILIRIIALKMITKLSFEDTIFNEKMFIRIASIWLILTVVFGTIAIIKGQPSFNSKPMISSKYSYNEELSNYIKENGTFDNDCYRITISREDKDKTYVIEYYPNKRLVGDIQYEFMCAIKYVSTNGEYKDCFGAIFFNANDLENATFSGEVNINENNKVVMEYTDVKLEDCPSLSYNSPPIVYNDSQVVVGNFKVDIYDGSDFDIDVYAERCWQCITVSANVTNIMLESLKPETFTLW